MLMIGAEEHSSTREETSLAGRCNTCAGSRVVQRAHQKATWVWTAELCDSVNCSLSHRISVQSVTGAKQPTNPPHHTLRNEDISQVISIHTVDGSEMKSTIQGIALLHDIWIPTEKRVWWYWVSLFLPSQYFPNKGASVSECHYFSFQLLSLPAWTWQLRWVTERSRF